MRRPQRCSWAAGVLGTAAAAVLPLVPAPAASEVMYGANCLSGLTQWSQEPDAEGRHHRLPAPIPIDDATRAWCEDQFQVLLETVPVVLDDGRSWYRLRATLPGTVTIGDQKLLQQLE